MPVHWGITQVLFILQMPTKSKSASKCTSYFIRKWHARAKQALFLKSSVSYWATRSLRHYSVPFTVFVKSFDHTHTHTQEEFTPFWSPRVWAGVRHPDRSPRWEEPDTRTLEEEEQKRSVPTQTHDGHMWCVSKPLTGPSALRSERESSERVSSRRIHHTGVKRRIRVRSADT